MENKPFSKNALKTKAFWIILTVFFLYWVYAFCQIDYAVTANLESYGSQATEIRFFVDHSRVLPNIGRALLMALGFMLPAYYLTRTTDSSYKNLLLHAGTGLGATLLALFVYISVDLTVPQWWWSFGVTFFVFIVFYGFYAKRLILPN